MGCLGGCIEPNLTLCEDGRACSANLVCDEIHHSCVTPEQLTVCTGLADGATCTAGDIIGKCYDNVCIVPGCGNKIVELNEQCDDGNERSGDGCSADCKSTESCGNGALDDAFGETCDDGNLASNDGCNSRCGEETVSWRAYPVHLAAIQRRSSAFDRDRARVVIFADTIWEWDGQHWHTPFVTVPRISQWVAAAYDPVAKLVVAFALDASKIRVFTWDGSLLSEQTTSGTQPTPTQINVAWFEPASKLMAIGSNDTFYYDVATATWTPIAHPAPSLGDAVFAFDASRSVMVMLEGSQPKTYQWNGSAWSSVMVRPRAAYGWSLVWDATYQRLLAVGGDTGTVDAFNGATWAPVMNGITRSDPVVWHDPTLGSIGVLGGGDESALVITNTAVAIVNEVHPINPVQTIVYDPVRARLLAFEQQGPAWSFTPNTWQLEAPPPGFVSSAVYDPVRAAVVVSVFNQTQGTSTLQRFTGSWSEIVTVTNGAGSLSYDYVEKRILISGGPMTMQTLSSTGTTLQTLPMAPWTSPASIAFDLGTSTIVALAMGIDSGLYDLVGTTWLPSLSPGIDYRIFSMLHTRSILMIPMNPAPTPRQVWERRNGEFKALGPLPIAMNSHARGVAELPHGRLIILIGGGASEILLERQWTSSLADETCMPGEDADDDGAAGCDDPDCWWSCEPTCPAATSCN
jgi:cysteine-rich repeat protein